MSKSNRFPNGLANGSGMVGRHLMFNCGAFAGGRFPGAINGYRGAKRPSALGSAKRDPRGGVLHGRPSSQ